MHRLHQLLKSPAPVKWLFYGDSLTEGSLHTFGYRDFVQLFEERIRCECELKRPNDIMIGAKKICGVLVESASKTQDRIDSAIIGIGLNVNAKAEEIFAAGISMKMVTGKDYSREEILHSLLEQLTKDLEGIYGTAPQPKNS